MSTPRPSKNRQVFHLSFDAEIPLLDVTWMDNAESNMCVICHDMFHFMKRKHHCRLCGRLVCNACSKARASVYLSRQLERTCRLCCSVLNTLESLGDKRVQSNVPAAAGTTKHAGLTAIPATSREHDYDRVMRVRRQLKVYQPASSQYYIVSAEWFQAWFDYSKRHGAHPGPISNHSLLSFYQGKLHAAQDRSYRLVHELIWCTLHELYGGGPIITTQAQCTMAWTIQMSEGEIVKTLVHTTTQRKKTPTKSSSIQCWFQMECNRHSLMRRASAAPGGHYGDDDEDFSTQSAVQAFAAAANQARRDAEGRISHTNLRLSMAQRQRLSGVHATM
ncbi:hypothetical protein B5M09_006952 [Aphanomyces astaci]|nr:hypothetical protein B5M09_006952 [Aphanomyces astaci]